jgi:hypothetical protein
MSSSGQSAVAALIDMAKSKGIEIPSGNRPEWLVTLLHKYGSAARAGVPASADEILTILAGVYAGGCDPELADVMSEAVVGLGVPETGATGGRRRRLRKVGGGFRELGGAIAKFFTTQCRRGATTVDKITTDMASAIESKAAEAEATPVDIVAALKWASAAGAVVVGVNEGLRTAVVDGLISVSSAMPTFGTMFTNTLTALEFSAQVAAGSGVIAGQTGVALFCVYIVYILREKLIEGGKSILALDGKTIWEAIKPLVTDSKFKEFMADMEKERQAIAILDAELDSMQRELKPEVRAAFSIPPVRRRRASLAALRSAPPLPTTDATVSDAVSGLVALVSGKPKTAGRRRRHTKTKKVAGRRRHHRRQTTKRAKSF